MNTINKHVCDYCIWYYRECEVPRNMKQYACDKAKKLKEENEQNR